MTATLVPAVHPAYRDHKPRTAETPAPGAYSDSAGPFCFPGALITSHTGSNFYYYDPELLIEGRHFIYSPTLGRNPRDGRSDRYWVELLVTPHF